jgi:hypothetical protein
MGQSLPRSLFKGLDRATTFTLAMSDQKSGARSRNRTSDTRIFNPLLYQLSYPGISSGYLSDLFGLYNHPIQI